MKSKIKSKVLRKCLKGVYRKVALEKAVDITLAEARKEVEEVKKNQRIIKINLNRFPTGEQRMAIELLIKKVNKDFQEDMNELLKKLGAKND